MDSDATVRGLAIYYARELANECKSWLVTVADGEHVLVNTVLSSPPEDPDDKWLGLTIASVYLLSDADLKMVYGLEAGLLRTLGRVGLDTNPAPKDLAIGMSFNLCSAAITTGRPSSHQARPTAWL
jgi:hypothetical protein